MKYESKDLIQNNDLLESELNLKTNQLDLTTTIIRGITHQFSNHVTAILGQLYLAHLNAEEPAELKENLIEIEQVATQARNLILSFANLVSPPSHSSLTQLIEKIAEVMTLGFKVNLVLDLPENSWEVEMNHAELGLVLQNLILNAIQAVPIHLKVSISNSNLSFPSDIPVDLPAGDYVEIIFHNNGVIITPSDLPHIFEPHFTTKSGSQGLGLSVSRWLVEKNNGRLVAESTPEVGSTFKVYLPAKRLSPLKPALPTPPVTSGELTSSSFATTPASPTQLTPGRGPSSVLVLDDEETLRSLLGELLHHLNYQATLAESGEEALRLYQQALNNRQPFDLVIMDLTLPGGISGLETIRQLKMLDPTVKAIVCSGQAQDDIMGNFERYGFTQALAKPYRLDQLKKVLIKVLG